MLGDPIEPTKDKNGFIVYSLYNYTGYNTWVKHKLSSWGVMTIPINKVFIYNTLWNTAVTNASKIIQKLWNIQTTRLEICGIPQTCHFFQKNEIPNLKMFHSSL